MPLFMSSSLMNLVIRRSPYDVGEEGHPCTDLRIPISQARTYYIVVEDSHKR